MTDDATTTSLLRQLAAHRQTAAHEAQRAARYGGAHAAPPEIAANLADARANIARLKADLRDLGVEVDDLPGDEPPPGAAPAPAPAAVVQQIIGGGSGNVQANNSTVNVTNYNYPPAPAGPARLTLSDMPIGDNAPIPEPAPLPPGSRMPLSRNPLFVGRADDLRELARALAGGATTAIAAATGLGGIGKTQLASEFAHRYGQYFAGGVFWLSFADPGAVSSEVAACGGAGGINILGLEDLPFDQQVARVKAAWLEPTPRLLVFDNCEDEALVDEWRPVSGGCRVLLTSRRARWDASLGVWALPLGVLPRAESVALLRGFRPDLPESDPDLDQIAAELGDLPLALHLAGSYLKRYARAVTPAAYLAQLRAPDRQWALLKLDGRSPTGHEQDVARTFLLSYGRLQPEQTTDALAVQLLARAAHLAPGEPMPRYLLAATVQLEGIDGALRLEDVLARLDELGLIDEEADGALRLHRLICAFARGEAQDEEAQAAVEQALITLSSQWNATGYTLHSLPVHTHLRYIADQEAANVTETSAQLCMSVGAMLKDQRALAESETYYQRALAIREQLFGLEHRATIASLHSLGMIRRLQGKLSEARPYLEQALALKEKMLGPNDPVVSNTLNELGALLQADGDLIGAQALLERGLTIRELAYGSGHLEIANSLGNLAMLKQAQGDLLGARAHLERALEIRMQCYGPDASATASTLNNLGLVLRELGDRQGAAQQLKQALSVYERVLGSEHPRTLATGRNLASVESQGS